jgi:hypothetical protein
MPSPEPFQGKPLSPAEAKALAYGRQAMRLRVEGHSVTAIAERMGFSPLAVKKYLTLAYKETRRLTGDDAARLRALEASRLDAFLTYLWPAIDSKDPKGRARAVEVALKVVEARVKLYGLAAPERIAVAQVDVTKLLSPAELEAEAQRLGLDPTAFAPDSGQDLIPLPGEVIDHDPAAVQLPPPGLPASPAEPADGSQPQAGGPGL